MLGEVLLAATTGGSHVRPHVKAPRNHRRAAGWAGVLGMIAVSAALLSPSPALAGHYHEVSAAAHGLKHGGSTFDGSYFSRLDKPGYSYEVICEVYHGTKTMDQDYRQGLTATSCSAWSWRNHDPRLPLNECQNGAAGVGATTTFGGDVASHIHFSHAIEDDVGCPSAMWIETTYLFVVP